MIAGTTVVKTTVKGFYLEHYGGKVPTTCHQEGYNTAGIAVVGLET
jgi:hypothetical protein